MIVTIYNRRGYPVETLEDVLVPRPSATGTLYIEYKGIGLTVVTKLVRSPGRGEDEKIVAVRTRRKLYVYGELPGRLAENVFTGTSSGNSLRIQ